MSLRISVFLWILPTILTVLFLQFQLQSEYRMFYAAQLDQGVFCHTELCQLFSAPGSLAEKQLALQQHFDQTYLRAGLVILLGWLVSSVGINRVLAPLYRIAQEIEQRGFHNLTPLSSVPLPEFEQAVHAMNRVLLDLQKGLKRQGVQEKAARHFALGASHELRNPLTAVKNYLEVLRRRPGEEKALEGALQEIWRAEDILNTLLTFVRIESRSQPALEAVQLRQYLQDNWDLEVQGDDIEVRIDTELLAIAIDNLLSNAQKHGQLPVLLEVQKQDHHVEIIVQDQGNGIPDELIERVFEPFVKKSSSTGLGLALVKVIAELHQGSVRVSNQPGARFVITLPAS